MLIYDESGDHPALQAAEIIARTGAKAELMTPERSLAPDIMALNLVPYMRVLQPLGVTFTLARRLLDIERHGNQLRAKIGSDYITDTQQRCFDQIVLNYGTMPLDELYFALKPLSSNLGEVDHDALIAGRSQAIRSNPQGTFQLFRIGDAVSARNIHAAIYDALRLMKDL